MHSRYRLLLVIVPVVLLSSCSSDSADTAKASIVGKWNYANSAEAGTLEFHDDGSVTIDLGNEKVTGTYKFDGAGRLHVDTNTRRKPLVVTVALSQNEFTMTDEDGTSVRCTRVH